MRGRKKQEPKLEDYPRFEKIRCHPRFSEHVWLVKLRNDPMEHAVRFGDLRGWLNEYAR